MTKSDLVSEVAKCAGVSEKEAKKALDAILKAIKEALEDGEKVGIRDLGTFSVKKRAARIGRNPRTGEPLKISAKKVPVFSAGKGLKSSV